MGISLKRLSQLQGKTISVVALVFMPRADHINKVLFDKNIRKNIRSLIVAISDRTEKNYNPFSFAWPEMDPDDLRFIWGTEPAEPNVIQGYARLLNTGIAYLLKALGKPTPVPDAFYR